MKIKSCCATGHREIPTSKIDFVQRELRKEISRAIEDGYCNFLSGFASGVDMMFVRLVAEAQAEHPEVTLEAALPYPSWMKGRSTEDRALLGKCNTVVVHSQKYSANCFLVRNRFMVNSCDRVIAVYDGRIKGGTVNTIRYAAVLERDLLIIRI